MMQMINCRRRNALPVLTVLIAVLPAVSASAFSVTGLGGTYSFPDPVIHGSGYGGGGGNSGAGAGGGGGGGGNSAAERAAEAAAEAARQEAIFQARLSAANQASDTKQASRQNSEKLTLSSQAYDVARQAAANLAQIGANRPGFADLGCGLNIGDACDQAHHLASLCFDNGCAVVHANIIDTSVVDVRDIVAALQRDPVVTDAQRQRAPEIAAWEKDRDAARQEKSVVDNQLREFQARPQGHEVEIVQLRDKGDKLETKAAWDNKQIRDKVVLLP